MQGNQSQSSHESRMHPRFKEPSHKPEFATPSRIAARGGGVYRIATTSGRMIIIATTRGITYIQRRFKDGSCPPGFIVLLPLDHRHLGECLCAYILLPDVSALLTPEAQTTCRGLSML